MTAPDEHDTTELDGLTAEDAEALLADAAAEDTEQATEEQDDDPDDDDPRLSKARKDAASYRERLRAAEAERERLTEELNEHRRDHITRLAAEAGMAAPEDLFAVVDETALYDPETGRVDPERVSTAARDALAARPHWRRPPTLPGRPQERLRGGSDPEAVPRKPSWADVVAPR